MNLLGMSWIPWSDSLSLQSHFELCRTLQNCTQCLTEICGEIWGFLNRCWALQPETWEMHVLLLVSKSICSWDQDNRQINSWCCRRKPCTRWCPHFPCWSTHPPCWSTHSPCLVSVCVLLTFTVFLCTSDFQSWLWSAFNTATFTATDDCVSLRECRFPSSDFSKRQCDTKDSTVVLIEMQYLLLEASLTLLLICCPEGCPTSALLHVLSKRCLTVAFLLPETKQECWTLPTTTSTPPLLCTLLC